jgi:hypothetical protein
MNNIGFFRVLGLMTAALMLAAVALQATAAEVQTGPEPHVIQWVWSATSPETNKATTALASGHAGRALWLSRVAMTHANKTSDRLIVIHNLCIAHLTQGDIVGADVHCRTALLTPDTTRVVLRRGALITVAGVAGDQGAPLTTVIRANIAEAYGVAAADSFTSSVEAAAW